MLRTISGEGAAAAEEVLDAWRRGEAVWVADPRAPGPSAARARAVARPGEPVADEVAAVVLTSGTTGAARAVELTWSGLEHSARVVSAALGADPGRDRWLCTLPLHHVAGLAVLARAHVTGVGLAFDAESPATLAAAVPTQLARLDARRFRAVLVGGGPLPPGTDLPPNAVTTYGLTETFGGIVHDGRPLPGTEVALDEGRVPVGTAPGTGLIRIRTPSLMRGYRGDPAATAAAVDEHGWLTTSDLGTLDGGDRLAIVGRADDVVVTGGVNVAPWAVEEVLAGHPAVAEVGVGGVPDATWGHRVVAYVVTREGWADVSLDELRELARSRLTPAELPRQVVHVSRLPRTTSGKLRRRALAAEARPGPSGEPGGR